MLQNADGIKEASNNLLDAQKNDLLLLEKQLNNYTTSVSGMTRSSCIDELITYIGWVENRIADLTRLVDDADLEPVCKGDSIVWPPNLTEFGSHCEILCHVAGSPHVPNCSVSVKSHPTIITIMLKDVNGFSVIDQSNYLKIKVKETQELYCDFQVKEQTRGQYCITYCPKGRKPYSINVMWKDTILNSEGIVLQIGCDYSAIQKETLIINEYESARFSNPWHLANGPKDELLVCDYNNHKVVVFNSDLHYSHSIGSQGKVYGKFQSPSGIAVDNMGYLYIADQGNHCIQKFNIDGSFVCQFGTHGSAQGQFNSPHGLLISKAGQLYVCDRGNNRVQVFQNHNFAFNLLFGRLGSGLGDFNTPSSMAFNNLETQLFVADSYNHRIQMFTPNGQVIGVFGASYGMNYPYGLFFTRDNHLLVTHQSNNVLMIIKENGTLLYNIQANGSFNTPAGVVVRHNGQIVVSGWGNNQLVVY